MKKYFYLFLFLTITFFVIGTGTLKAQRSVLLYNFEGYSLGDSVSIGGISYGPADIKNVIVTDPLASGNQVLKVTTTNYGAAPVLIFVLPAGKTLADYNSITFKGYYQAGDLTYKTILAEAYQTKPTGHHLTDSDTNYSYVRTQGASTGWEQISLAAKKISTFHDTVYIAIGTNNSGSTWYLDDVTLVIQGVDSTKIWTGPALATGSPKFLGNIPSEPPENAFTKYWNQVTPENAGKWGSVGTSTDTTQWNWSRLDAQYNFAMTNHLPYKHHNLIWGNQQPSWISSLDTATQYKYIVTWFRDVGQRYPNIDMVDVVNEPMIGHNPPDGQNGHANYINALGGEGLTMWNWLIKSFQLARQYLPHAKLLINDYGIINNYGSTTSYIQIIGLLKDRGLIDGIGEQGHGFETTSADTIKSNLDRLAALGLPIYISEFDLNIQDDNQQMAKYQELFPILWQHPAVKGITLWGYNQGKTWVPYSYLVNTDGTYRPALKWLADYIKNNPTGVEVSTTGVPSKYQLEQNYPNPFNPSTTIRYSITHITNVTLKVFDMLGREVQSLVNTTQGPGQYSVVLNAQNLGSGVYFYRLQAGNFSDIKKLVLIK